MLHAGCAFQKGGKICLCFQTLKKCLFLNVSFAAAAAAVAFALFSFFAAARVCVLMHERPLTPQDGARCLSNFALLPAKLFARVNAALPSWFLVYDKTRYIYYLGLRKTIFVQLFIMYKTTSGSLGKVRHNE